MGLSDHGRDHDGDAQSAASDPFAELAALRVDLDALAGRLRATAERLDEVRPVQDPVTAARRILRMRRRRDALFDGVFGEPAWDMLLNLYVANADARRVAVSSACAAAAVPPTTALRCMTALEEAGLIKREPDQQHRRRIHVSLSAHAEAMLTELLSTAMNLLNTAL